MLINYVTLCREGMKSQSGRRRGQIPPISLFESKELKVVPQWRRPMPVMDLPSSGTPAESLKPSDAVNENLQSLEGADRNLQLSDKLAVSVEDSVVSSDTDDQSSAALSSDAVASSSLSASEMPSEATTVVAGFHGEREKAMKANDQPSMTIFVQQKVRD